MATFPPPDIGQAIAQWLAPLVAAELRKTAGDVPVRNADYDDDTCRLFVTELGTGVLNRAADFFGKLEQDGEIDSLELARVLGIDTPRNIPANLTNSLKQRARALGLERPWRETVSATDRTVWVDRDDIAGRMVRAIRAEHHQRFGPRT